jgi:hypothetical protein
MEYSEHGGNCCGISHVHMFDYSTVAQLDDVIRRHDNGDEEGVYEHHDGPGRILEAVLSHRQFSQGGTDARIHQSVRDAGGWAAVLAARNFILVNAFLNSNTGRKVFVFHRNQGRGSPIDITNDRGLSFTWNGPRQQQRAAPQPAAEIRPRRLLITTYHNRFNDGHRGAGFDTRDAARQAAPRCRRIDQRNVYANGEIEWIEGV